MKSIVKDFRNYCLWISKWLLSFTLGIILIVQIMNGCDSWALDLIKYGFAESNFELSPESRLPRWFEIPKGLSRNQITMTIDFFLGEPVKIKARGPFPLRRIIYKNIGVSKIHPDTEKSYIEGQGFKEPFYIIITIDGVSEIFESREKNSVLHITDDPQITSIIKNNKTSIPNK